MGHRRLYNHHGHDHGKIAGIVEDIRTQTERLEDAVKSATSPPDPPPPSGNPADQLDNLRLVAAALQAVIDDIASGAPDQHKKPHPQPKPVPQPQQPPSGITWPSFTGKDALVGHSPSGMVSVYVDASLGSEAQQNAADLLADSDRVVGINNSLFGKTQSVPVRVLLFEMGATDGTGGADHMGCDFASGGDIEVCVAYGDSSRCSGLFEAELSECAMNNQLCGLSTGEALSRWCAAIASNNSLADFASAPQWAQDGYADWVSQVEQTDQGFDSIGCGMAFISYLLHRGATMPVIAQAMVRLGDAGTLADLYYALKMGPAAMAWTTFLATVKTLGPLTSDDPFAQVAMAMRQHEHI